MRIPKKVWIPVVVVAALVGAYAIAGFWWAPRYIRAEFTRFVAQDLKKQPRLGEVKVNPFTLRASIADLGIHEPAGERIVGFSRLDGDVSRSAPCGSAGRCSTTSPSRRRSCRRWCARTAR
jgi:hypothetical protein